MTPACSKFVVLPILLLGSWTILAGQAPATGPRTIHFATDVTAPNETLRDALAKAMESFSGIKFVQAKFIATKNADYVFSDPVVTTSISKIRVTMNYRGPNGTSKREKDCRHGCDASAIEGLFHQLLDETLFHPSDGLYRPMRIRQCQPVGLIGIRASVEPANEMTLERDLLYGIADPADLGGSRWQARVVTPRLAVDELGVDHLSATFELIGNARTITAFRARDCSARLPLLAMQPRAVLLSLNTGERNPNVSSGN